jgi:hypothetical protein
MFIGYVPRRCRQNKNIRLMFLRDLDEHNSYVHKSYVPRGSPWNISYVFWSFNKPEVMPEHGSNHRPLAMIFNL